MEPLPGQKLVPETEGGRGFQIVVQAGADDHWVDMVPAFLRSHLLPTIPDDGKLYSVRITWTIGGW